MRNWDQRINRLQQRQAAGNLRPGMQKRLGNLERMQAAGQLQGDRQPLGNISQPQNRPMPAPTQGMQPMPQGNQQMLQTNTPYSPEMLDAAFNQMEQSQMGMPQQPQNPFVQGQGLAFGRPTGLGQLQQSQQQQLQQQPYYNPFYRGGY